MRNLALHILAAALFLTPPLSAADDEEPEPPPKKPGVRITFLPPPLDGTLSLGLYDKSGKLVRILHREATTNDFTVGLNGLITFWDGKDDAGQIAPAGKYEARGFAVGALTFAGEAFHGNEWVGEDGQPRLQRINDLRFSDGALQVWAVLPDSRAVAGAVSVKGEVGELQTVATEQFADPKWNALAAAGERFAGKPVTVLDGNDPLLAICDNRLLLREGEVWRWLDFPTVNRALHACFGRENTIWVIDQTESAVEVKQYSFAGEFQRRLTIDPKDPPPIRIAADPESDAIALLEIEPTLQRVRLLKHVDTPAASASAEASSTWQVSLSKAIRSNGELSSVEGQFKTSNGGTFAPEESISVRLLPNQLLRNASATVNVKVGIDARGSVLQSTDGLPLRRIADTPRLRWAALMREPAGKTVTIFQSDGAVVEEFQARGLTKMMAFDAGDYEWSGK